MNINWSFLDKVNWADVGATLTLLGIIFAFLTYIYIRDQKRTDEKFISNKDMVKEIVDGAVDKIKLIYQHQETLYNLHHKQNEEAHESFLDAVKDNYKEIVLIKDQLKDYSVINHDVYNFELNEISMTEKLCVLSVINMCIEQSLKVKNKGATNHEEFFDVVRLAVSRMMTEDQAYLAMKGVHDRTIGLWVENQHELFPVFEQWIIRKYEKLATLTGNGSLDVLIQDAWMDLGREMTSEFMKRLKKKLVLKNGDTIIDPVDWEEIVEKNKKL